MTTLLHPLDEPRYAALWAPLVALVGALGRVIAPAGTGQIPVRLALRKEARAGLRLAEGLLRRLLVPVAEAYIPELPPRRPVPAALTDPDRQAPVTAPGGESAAAQWPSAAPDSTRGAPGRADPWLFRLHEARGRSVSRAGARATDPQGDYFGTRQVSIARECQRFSTLVATVEAPGHAIYRLALILRRHRAAAEAAADDDGQASGSSGPGGRRAPGRPPPLLAGDWAPPAALGCHPAPVLAALAALEAAPAPGVPPPPLLPASLAPAR